VGRASRLPECSRHALHLAKITHRISLPQGQPQRDERTLSMVVAMANEASAVARTMAK